MRLGVLFRRRRSAPWGTFFIEAGRFRGYTGSVQRQKLDSLGQLTAGIAHEIKNPLNFVNNFSSVSAELLYELRENLGKVKADAALTPTMQRLQVELIGGLRRHKLHRWT